MRYEHETKNLELLEEHRKKIESLISEMSNITSKDEGILASKTKKLSQINGYTRKLLNYRNIPKIESSNPPVLKNSLKNTNNELNIGMENLEAKLTHSFTIPSSKSSSPSPTRLASRQTRPHYNNREICKTLELLQKVFR